MVNGEQELEFPINQQLLEDATRCMEEWKVIRDRLRKIEEHRTGVSEQVYERVKNDYQQKYSSATDSLLSKKEEIDREIMLLQESRKKIEGHLQEHLHSLEEIKFRNTLGEYIEDDYLQKSQTEQDRISKFETILAAVDSNIERYNTIFEGEDIFVKPSPVQVQANEEVAEHPIADMDTSEFTPAVADHEPLTDDSGYVLDESSHNYFSTTQKEIEYEKPFEAEESATARNDIQDVASPSPTGIKPRVVILSGENAGTAYPLRGILSIGRADTNTIPLKDGKCSRQHSQIQQKGNEFIIVDLNSSNGTFVNGERIEEHVLANGDEILVGDTLIQFQVEA